MAEELERLRNQAEQDRKLIQKAADALAEIDRAQGLSDEHADVLTALRIRLEGKKRASLDELLAATGDLSGAGGRDLSDSISGGQEGTRDWPEVKDKRKDWPGA